MAPVLEKEPTKTDRYGESISEYTVYGVTSRLLGQATHPGELTHICNGVAT